MDFNTLVADKTTPGSIQYSINYTRIDSAGIVTEAEAYIYSRIRVREMRATHTFTIASGASNAAYPDDYLDPIQIGIPGWINRIRLRDEEYFRTVLGFDETGTLPTGLPALWTDYDGLMQFNTLADQDYSAVLTYYKTPLALSSGNPTNFLTKRYPTLVRRACLMFAAEARKEMDTYTEEEKRVLDAIENMKVEGDLSRRGAEYDMNWAATDGDGEYC
jgi:hypothetical protein